MNLKNKTAGGQAGFSLVELMVVVGIIGLLAAIAVPQFSKFQARARQSEAKALMASIFSGEKSFFSEWNVYTASMSNAGVGTTGNKLRYNGGVSQAGAVCTPAASYPTQAPGDSYVTVFAASNLTASNAAYDTTGAFAAPTDITAGQVCNHTTQSFTAMVWGDPNNTAVTPYNADQWSITHMKVISNTANGIR